MVEYCVSQMLHDLSQIEIPSQWEAEFVANVRYKKKGTFSTAQYNRVLIIFNKCIGVPASIPSYKYDGSNRG
jgi:hypothetical protein